MAAKRGLFVISAKNAEVQISDDGITWYDVHGAGNVSRPSDTRETATISAFSGSTKVVGDLDISDMTIDLRGYVPFARVMDVMQQAANDSEVLSWRIKMQPGSKAYRGTTTAAEDAVAIAQAMSDDHLGGCTFSGTASDAAKRYFATGRPMRGHVMKVGSDFYIIEQITLDDDGNLSDFSAGASTSDPPSGGVIVSQRDLSATAGAQVSGPSKVIDMVSVPAAYALWRPGTFYEFGGTIASMPGIEAGSEAANPLSGSITVSPTEAQQAMNLLLPSGA